MELLYSKDYVEQKTKELELIVKEYYLKTGKAPVLKIYLTTSDPASITYVNNKISKAKQIGVIAILEDVKNLDSLAIMRKLNEDAKNNEVTGIIIQLPLRKDLQKYQKTFETIICEKDIDGFTEYGHLMRKEEPKFYPCTPLGIVNFLKYKNVDLVGKNVCIVGAGAVGRPLSMMMLNEGATVSVLNSKTKDISLYTKNADIIVTCSTVPKMLKSEHVKDGTIIIDVGIFRDENNKLCGNVDVSTFENRNVSITPVPGGVGPITVITLIEQLVNTFFKNIE